jgi:type IV secretory pathway VirB9-like protein
MRKVLVAVLLWSALSASSVSAQSGGVREVTATDRHVITLHTRIRFTTMIILPAGEDIVDVICGDKEFWVISATHDIAHVKPAKEGATTNLNLVTASGTVYSFILVEGKAIATPDLKVYVVADTTTTGIAGKPKYVTAAQLEAVESELQSARAAIQAAHQMREKAVDEVKAAVPTTLKFPYQPVPYVKPFWIRSMWTDGQFTYVRTDAKERPVLYELVDGTPAIINFQVPTPDTYVVPKVLEEAVFVLGNKRLPIKALRN